MVATTTRVEENTDESVNARIRRQTKRDILYSVDQGNGKIDRRIKELDIEWDVERTLEANAASLSLLGLGRSSIVVFFSFPLS